MTINFQGYVPVIPLKNCPFIKQSMYMDPKHSIITGLNYNITACWLDSVRAIHSRFQLVSVAEKADMYLPFSLTSKLGFLATWLIWSDTV